MHQYLGHAVMAMVSKAVKIQILHAVMPMTIVHASVSPGGDCQNLCWKGVEELERCRGAVMYTMSS